jgi:hypothetical protein
MPWKECSVVDERLQFVARRVAGEPMAELCSGSFSVSAMPIQPFIGELTAECSTQALQSLQLKDDGSLDRCTRCSSPALQAAEITPNALLLSFTLFFFSNLGHLLFAQELTPMLRRDRVLPHFCHSWSVCLKHLLRGHSLSSFTRSAALQRFRKFPRFTDWCSEESTYVWVNCPVLVQNIPVWSLVCNHCATRAL